ncbi:plant cysteine oxidase 2-like isoform X2 [Chenopodium quinoa]|uniref:plant cysteine oxidase 2-like isoform X2 n=1 Tax=Chenopodium quinoa TaxID=63459 RepID=UPI000B773026|nr:plant cysteine oxidase 2-like isoform X2 [Chenopodium quinoa]
MGIEPGYSDKIATEIEKTTTNRSKSSRKNRRRNRKMAAVQTLFNVCKEVFADGGVGFIPCPDDVERLRSILNSLTQDDVGLSPELPYFRPIRIGNSRAPIITYLHLYECDKFSIGIFCLPPSGVLPLHNHPGMTVFSKLLFGTMHIKSYDWVEGDPYTTAVSENAPPARLAKLTVNEDFVAPCNTSILYPAAGGNMHCFTAMTACAVLDVLGPPYSDPDGRHCTYYREYPFDRFSDGISGLEQEKDRLAWLQDREKPRSLTVFGASYRGPRIVDG